MIKSKFLSWSVFSLLAWFGGFGFAGGLHAATGDVDLSFDAGSFVNGTTYAVAVQPDGKILVGGSFTTVRGAVRRGIARLNADGVADLGFNPGLGTSNSFFADGNGPVYCLALQADGKVVIGGEFTAVNGTNRNNIARLNSDGSLDLSFNPGSGASHPVRSVAVQTNGQVVIGGEFISVNGTNRNGIARLNSNGSLDLGFDPGTGATGVNSVALQSDGKVVLGGIFTSVNGTNRGRIARLNSNGSLDPGFNPGSGADFDVNCVAVQTDGKIIIGGLFSTVNGTNRFQIARLNSNGSLDSVSASVGPGGFRAVNCLVVQTNGQIIIAGDFTNVNGSSRPGIARLNTDFSLDGFNPGSDEVFAIALQADGKAIIGTVSSVYRLTTAGPLDNTFTARSGVIGTLHCIVAQPDGKVLVGGVFESTSGTNIVRLNADGSRDQSFIAGVRRGFSASSINAIAVQTNGQILIGGNFSTVNGITRTHLARLNTNGSVDATFDAGPISSTAAVVNGIVVQTNGQIVIGGTFFDINGTARNGIARLNFNGSLDNGFNPAIGGLVFSLALQTNGQIVFGTSTAVFRLNNNGTTDGSFAAIPNNTVNAIAIQSDGKVVIGGDFNNFGAPARNYIARLNTNGNLDATFVPGSGANNPVKAVALPADGKILIAGNFTSVNGTNRNRIARLNSNGTLDAAFSPGAGADQVVNSMFLQPDGHILLGGQFAAINTTARAFAARLLGETIGQLQLTNPGISNGLFRFNISGSPSQIVVVEGSTNLQQWIAISTNSLSNGPVIFSDPQSPNFRNRFYRGRIAP